MNSFTNNAQRCTYGIAIGLAGCATCYTSYAVSSFLGRLVYPLSQYDGKDLHEDEVATGFFAPNAGIRIDEDQYEQLSTIKKIANATLLLFTGALTGAFTGICITGIAVLAMNLANPIFLTLIGTVSCSVIGVVVGGLHDPKIGVPFLYRAMF
jgi:hypothetical protein